MKLFLTIFIVLFLIQDLTLARIPSDDDDEGIEMNENEREMVGRRNYFPDNGRSGERYIRKLLKMIRGFNSSGSINATANPSMPSVNQSVTFSPHTNVSVQTSATSNPSNFTTGSPSASHWTALYTHPPTGASVIPTSSPLPGKDCSNRFTATPPPYPNNNATTAMPPHPPALGINDFIQNHWLRSNCPVIEEFVSHMFHMFPQDPIDDKVVINRDDFDVMAEDSYNIFLLSKNAKIFARDLATHIASRVLYDRSMCPVLKLQQICVFSLRKELDRALNRSDDSLFTRLQAIMMPYMPHSEEVATGIVHATHKILFEEVIHLILDAELGDLSDVITNVQQNFEHLPNSGSFGLSKIKHEIEQMLILNPTSFRCTYPNEFIEMHKRIAKKVQERLTGDIIQNMFMGTVERILRDLHVRMGVMVIDQTAIDALINTLRNYVQGAVWVFNKYEDIINSGNILRFEELFKDILTPKQMSFFLRISAYFSLTPGQVPTW